MIENEMEAILEWHRKLGARPCQAGTGFSVWAPTANQIRVHIVDGPEFRLKSDGNGLHSVVREDVKVGDRYWIQADDTPPRPDPASRFQPEGVHGPSEVVSRDFAWTDAAWKGQPPRDWILYELHIGAWTDEGTMSAEIDRLDELVDLGVTAIELMPLADAAGRWNWGYDGVNLFAPNRNYGRPEDVKRFVDVAHAKGLAVFLDVVYNHLGPEGNYLADVGPYLSSQHQTTWGPGPNFDDPQHGQGVKRFILANALYWLDEFHFDGLRVDAVHCILDTSRPHIVEELGRAVAAWSSHTGRPADLIAESNVHDTPMIQPIDQGGVGFTAEWCDDFLHSLFAVVRPGEQLCDRPYEPGSDLCQTLQRGYVYEGTLFEPLHRPKVLERVDTSGLIYSIQTHDFVGNHPLGQRLHQLTCVETQRACAALLMLTPAIPMLFMGEEFASDQPFRFFVDFGDPHLQESVVNGRQREYPQHDWSTGILPTDVAAFEHSKIGTAKSGNIELRTWYQALIKIRKQWNKQGLLRDENLTAICDQRRGIYRIDYQTPERSATVVARLTSVAETEFESIEIESTGTLLLDSRPGSDVTKLSPNHAKVFVNER
ncbi:MAG: malto-oligosyltrehalose trehalohydrolase [Planctomycetota bacterium]